MGHVWAKERGSSESMSGPGGKFIGEEVRKQEVKKEVDFLTYLCYPCRVIHGCHDRNEYAVTKVPTVLLWRFP